MTTQSTQRRLRRHGVDFQRVDILLYTVSQENCAAKLFSSELRQISTNFDNFWQKDDQQAKIMRGLLIST